MPIKFKHKKTFIFPDIKRIKDIDTQRFADDISRMIKQALENIYDDLHQYGYAEQTTALPTASADYVGKMYLYNDGTSSAPDTLYICTDTGGEGYKWRDAAISP